LIFAFKKNAACVVLASGGYPGTYQTGFAVSGLDKNGQTAGAEIFHAGTEYKD
jgi:phosphoribosylamine--glycine ligase